MNKHTIKAYYKIGGQDSVEYVTYVDTYDIERITADIRKRWDVAPDIEITVRVPAEVVKEATVVEFTLTDEQMASVQAAITDRGETAGLLAVWEAILGAPLAERETDLNPGMWAIPFTQWEEIAGYMIADSRVQHPSYEGIPAFSMVNQGPGSFTPTDDA